MKWRCTVCKEIIEQEKQPEECKQCHTPKFKIKALYFKPRKKSHADEPEADEQ